LSAVDYHNLMLDRLDKISDERVNALGGMERDKLRVARAYNKRVKKKLSQTAAVPPSLMSLPTWDFEANL
jgi:hypothetical protein